MFEKVITNFDKYNVRVIIDIEQNQAEIRSYNFMEFIVTIVKFSIGPKFIEIKNSNNFKNY